jgi:hypothetical protein
LFVFTKGTILTTVVHTYITYIIGT